MSRYPSPVGTLASTTTGIFCALILCFNTSAVAQEHVHNTDADEHGFFGTLEASPGDLEEVSDLLDSIYDFEIPYPSEFSMKDKQVAVYADGLDDAILWNYNGHGERKTVAKSSLPAEHTFSDFSYGKLHGRDTIFIRYYGDPEVTFSFAVHEGYHFYGQSWLSEFHSLPAKPRGTFYPENVEYHYLMREIFSRLYDHIEGDNPSGAQQALYYHNLLKEREFVALEADLFTNISEGTANFVEYIFLAAAKNRALQADFPRLARAAFEMDYRGYPASFRDEDSRHMIFDKGFEYYKISALPYYFLSMNGMGNHIEKLLDVAYPYELLRFVVNPQPADPDEQLRLAITEYFEQYNKRIKSRIDSVLARSRSAAYTTIQINSSLFTGSGTYGEFITFERQGDYVTLNTDTSISNVDGSVALNNIDTVSVVDGYNYYYEVNVLSESVAVAGLKLTVDSDHAEILNKRFSEVGDIYRVDRD